MAKGLAAAAILVVLAAAPASAAPGELDRSFGDAGIVDLRAKLTGEPLDLAGVGGGKIVVLSLDEHCDAAAPCSYSLLLTRFRSNGARDRTFGAGAAEVIVPGLQRGGFAVDSRGRLVVAGVSGESFKVIRFLPDGSVDSSFGSGGVAVADIGPEVSIGAVAIGKGDGIVVAGMRLESDRSNSTFPFDSTVFLAKFRPGGALDRRFHETGVAALALPEQGVEGPLATRSGVSFTAWAQCCSATAGLHVARVRANGTLDRRFGPPQRAVFFGGSPPHGAGNVRVAGLIPRARGRLDVVGSINTEGFLVRLGRNGKPVRSFGRDGVRLFRVPFAAATADGFGRVIAAGEDFRRPGVIVARLLPSGRRDLRFGERGYSERVANFGFLSRPIVAAASNGSPLVIDEGLPGCREPCPPHPILFRLRGGRTPRRH